MFYMGQHVVCVDDDEDNHYGDPGRSREVGGLDGLRRGAVYTVAASYISPTHRVPVVVVAEIWRPRHSDSELYSHEPGFAAARFRPVDETKLSIFKAMLVSPPKENVEA